MIFIIYILGENQTRLNKIEQNNCKLMNCSRRTTIILTGHIYERGYVFLDEIPSKI